MSDLIFKTIAVVLLTLVIVSTSASIQRTKDTSKQNKASIYIPVV